MPLYEYQCKSCGDEFEKMVRFSEINKIQECPICQSQETQKKISLISSKGSGSSSGLNLGSSCAPGAFT
jgi:putative FmdB family regulatory protein